MHSKGYTLIFATVVTVTCSLLLTIASSSLKPLQETQKELFVKKNILKVLDLEPKENVTAQEILDSYKKNISFFFINLDGEKVSPPPGGDHFDQLKEFKRFGIPYNTPTSVEEIKRTKEYQKNPMKLIVFTRNSQEGTVLSYAFPVFGKGLWSTIRAYLALKKDMNTVQGITFYEHAETPGLGARIEEQWFTDNFKEKTIFNEHGILVSISVIKGGVDSNKPEQVKHGVDGISGATITSHGVNNFLATDLSLYEPFLKKMQHQQQKNQRDETNE